MINCFTSQCNLINKLANDRTNPVRPISDCPKKNSGSDGLSVRCGVRTHDPIQGPELKSGALTTRPI